MSSSNTVTIVDYGMGNVGSLINMFRRIGVQSEVASNRRAIEQAKKIMLPGVGAFDAAMNRISALGLRDVLRSKALDEQVPFMGICLGMQLLTRSSEESPGTPRARSHPCQNPAFSTSRGAQGSAHGVERSNHHQVHCTY